jgi:Cu+-exporting ATPase
MSQTVKDLVCGMMVDPKTAADSSDCKGQTVHFCSAECKKGFDKEPEKYLEKEAAGSHSHH